MIELFIKWWNKLEHKADVNLFSKETGLSKEAVERIFERTDARAEEERQIIEKQKASGPRSKEG